MNPEPQKLALRRGEVIAWTGITRHELRKLIADGIVHGCRLTSNGRLYFYREHIRETVMKRLTNKEEKGP